MEYHTTNRKGPDMNNALKQYTNENGWNTIRVNGYENDTDHARLKVQIIRQAIEADPNNLDLYERWSDLELMLGDLLGANY